MYRILIYASYLEVGEARFSDKGGSTTIHVETDAVFVSLHVQSGEWFTITQSGKNIILDIKENKGAKERQMSFTVLTGVIDYKRRINKKMTIIQAGKGATYINTEPQSIELTERENNGVSTKTVRIDTDGDNWEIVTCPEWVWYKTEGNELELAAKTTAEQNREGVILLKSYNEYTNVRVTQKLKPKTTPAPTPVPTPAPKPVQPEPKPLPSYNTHYYNVPDASSFTKIMVVNQEVDGGKANEIWKMYESQGWRFPTVDELVFLFNNYENYLPYLDNGYWRFDGRDSNRSGCNLQGMQRGYEYDAYNRVVLVK